MGHPAMGHVGVRIERRIRGSAFGLGCAVLLTLAALLPRLLGVGETTSMDEDEWMSRSVQFARALSAGDWDGTYQSGHPGVVTTWVTSLALGQSRMRGLVGTESGGRVWQSQDFVPALRAARTVFAALGALLAVACGLLTMRLLGRGPGLMSGVLLSLDPYWSAMSPVVGMDGLLAGLLGSSLLSALLAFRATGGPTPGENAGPVARPRSESSPANGQWAWALVSGCLAGLAALTKSPAVLLIPIVLILALLESQRAPWGAADGKSAARKLVVWGVAAIATGAIWPALLVDPLGTAARTSEFVISRGGPVEDLPQGLLFVPAALAFRLGPATVLGLAFLAASGAPRPWWRLIGSLAAFALLFGLAVAISRKDADRYLLPLFPPLGILAALGWWSASRRLTPALRRAWIMPLALGALLQAWPLLATRSHPLAAYNPLFGGAAAAQAAISVGWGEGLGDVGAFLAGQPDAGGLVIGIWDPMLHNFAAHAPGRAVGIKVSSRGRVRNSELFAEADYYVDYIRPRRQGMVPSELRKRRPELVVSINGLEYARLYRLKPSGVSGTSVRDE